MNIIAATLSCLIMISIIFGQIARVVSQARKCDWLRHNRMRIDARVIDIIGGARFSRIGEHISTGHYYIISAQ